MSNLKSQNHISKIKSYAIPTQACPVLRYGVGIQGRGKRFDFLLVSLRFDS
jgi:hypothetical protein